MSLTPGTKLSSYEILDPIGAGGMGEVYRARDTKLGREVAIKVLPEAFAQNEERLARFQREARLLASLNHPNIATLYGFEQSDGVQFLVMELADGETLAERLRRAPIPVEDTLPIFKQIAEALEAAHEKGIIHRDLKPANIKVSSEGKVKVLDFGLAKAMSGDSVKGDVSESPTITRDATATGVILGTAAYMSPEQARGKPVDKRTDVWAFGAVLYEALTGRVAFLGETVSDTISAILRGEPDWRALPQATPAIVRSLLRRCLQKDSRERMHDIADARIEIVEAMSETSAGTDGAARSREPSRLLLWGLAMLAALATGVAIWSLLRPIPMRQRTPARFAINLPTSEPLAMIPETPGLALSPDGTRIVYVADRGGTTQLYVREMGRVAVVPIPGTEGGFSPFFSPDGQWVGFFAEGKLKKVPVRGGTPILLCDAPPELPTASWGPEDTIFLAGFGAELSRVSAGGGAVKSLAIEGEQSGEFNYLPEVLPNGRALLFTTNAGGSSADARIDVLSLETGERRTLVEGGVQPRYVPTGHVLYARAGSLFAMPFDLAQLKVTGPPVSILEGVLSYSTGGFAQFAISSDGTLVYAPGAYGAPGGEDRTLHWVNRRGEAEPLREDQRSYEWLKFSPDGKRLAITILEGPTSNLWSYDVTRGTLSKLTFDKSSIAAIWTPDGKRLAFASDRGGQFNVYWQPADGSGPAERLTSSENWQYPSSWTPDGEVLAIQEFDPATGQDIWLVPMVNDRKPRPFLKTPFNERDAAFSPDGRWLAYTSDESGRYEVYMQAFTGASVKWQISTDGGVEPVWAPGGRELYFRTGSLETPGHELMAVAIETEPEFTASKPTLLFEGRYNYSVASGAWYDIDPASRRFVMIRSEEGPGLTQLNVVQNWFEELKRLVPTN